MPLKRIRIPKNYYMSANDKVDYVIQEGKYEYIKKNGLAADGRGYVTRKMIKSYYRFHREEVDEAYMQDKGISNRVNNLVKEVFDKET